MYAARKLLALAGLAGLLAAATGVLSPSTADAQPPHRRSPAPRHVAPAVRHPAPPKVVRPGPSPIAALARTVNYLLAPPKGHVVVTVGGVRYYRHGGLYYRPVWRDGRWVYVTVAPPAGVVVTTLPPAPERVVINGHVYYRDGSTFYTQSSSPAAPVTVVESSPAPATTEPQYVVTRPPVGALVEQLPATATPVVSGSTTYFQSDGVHYLPIQVGEQTKYVVVDKPN